MRNELRTTPFKNNSGSHATTDAAVNLAHDLIDRAASRLQTQEERLRARAATTSEALRRSLDATQQQGLRARDSTFDLLARHPFATVAIALGAGALLTLLSRSSRLRNHDTQLTRDESQSNSERPGEATH